jgi:hypothetical protein
MNLSARGLLQQSVCSAARAGAWAGGTRTPVGTLPWAPCVGALWTALGAQRFFCMISRCPGAATPYGCRGVVPRTAVGDDAAHRCDAPAQLCACRWVGFWAYFHRTTLIRLLACNTLADPHQHTPGPLKKKTQSYGWGRPATRASARTQRPQRETCWPAVMGQVAGRAAATVSGCRASATAAAAAAVTRSIEQQRMRT